MEKKIMWISVVYFIFSSITLVCADTIYTKDGEVINAKIVNETGKTIWYEAQGGRVGIAKDSVARIEKSDGAFSKNSPNFRNAESIEQDISQPDYIEVFEERWNDQDQEAEGIKENIAVTMDEPEPPYDMEFIDKLERGVPYVGTFKHPFTGETLKREIIGIEGDKCVYIEEMPGGGRMECRYSESQRGAVAKYYKDILSSKSWETDAHLTPDKETTKITYKIDGKEVENPLQEAIDSGACVIKGYGQNE